MNTGITTNAAARILGVSANTLRSWERRFGYPKPRRTPGNHRRYELIELQTLRDALAETGNIGAAMELVRQRQSAPGAHSGLQAALESFDEVSADRAMEASLAMRSLERTVEELLLPTLDGLASDRERVAELEFACHWATGWLHGARRLAATASRPAGILLLQTGTATRVESVHAQGLDLALRRAGFRVLALSSELGYERLERALRVLQPTAIVLCGPNDGGRAAELLRRIRRIGIQSPCYAFRMPAMDVGGDIPVAEAPSEVTQALNTDLRRRAATAFA